MKKGFFQNKKVVLQMQINWKFNNHLWGLQMVWVYYLHFCDAINKSL